MTEIEAAFGASTERRRQLMQLLRRGAANLAAAGVGKIWLDGSFVTDKEEPNDIDGCWQYDLSVDESELNSVFLGPRQDMKNKYGLDFFISDIIEAASGLPFPKFFQVNRDGEAKGVIVVILRE